MEDKLVYLKKLITDKMGRSRLITLLLLLGLLLVAYLIFWGYSDKKAESEQLVNLAKEEQVISKAETSSSTSEVGSGQEIVVDLKGAVKQEGVYHLEAGSRVTDLIKLAGGLKEEADKDALNLAQKLSDEALIYVAKKGENRPESPSSLTAAGLKEEKKEKVNLNKADLEDLTKIPGVGEKRAKEILESREKMGGFKSLDDLLKISGIGQKTLEKLKNDISVD
ncbi:helix-hairpin-helix domain-containing protein [Streptococcus catagoni]|uniref:helix-hairpin-helix domain-containing protein n=1 Tax=Streptococcus catagoni TaxID=2654874 RepID=UPI0014082D8B|nr:helix-hairpin-helix domain-containing protein [Streptococcus catagoni]